MKNYWTKSENQILIDSWNTESRDTILTRLPGRSWYACKTKAREVGIALNNYWTNQEIEIILKHYGSISNNDLVTMFPKRSKDAIVQKASQLGLLHNEVSRFWMKVNKDTGCFGNKRQSSQCWYWTGDISQDGYGRFYPKDKMILAHRYAYELANDCIPANLVCHHKCYTTYCVNPNHLEAVTIKYNVLDGNGICAQNKRKIYCKHGHPLFGDNLRISKDKERVCKKCARRRNKKYQTSRKLRIKHASSTHV